MKLTTLISLIFGLLAAQSAVAFPAFNSVDVLGINKSTLEKINDRDTLVIAGVLEGNLCDNPIENLMLFPQVEKANKKGEVKITTSFQSGALSELSFVGKACLTFSRLTPFKIGLDVSQVFSDTKVKSLKLTFKKNYEENLNYVVKSGADGLTLVTKPDEEAEEEWVKNEDRITINKYVAAPYAVKSLSEAQVAEELIRPIDSFNGNEVMFYVDVKGPTLRCPESQGINLESFYVSDASFKELNAKLYYGLYSYDKFKDDSGFEAVQLPLVPVTCALDPETELELNLSVRISDRDESSSPDEVPATVTKRVVIHTVDPSGKAKVYTYKATRNKVQRWTVAKDQIN